MMHRHLGHPKPPGMRQHGNEAMQLAIEGQLPGDLRSQTFEATVVVVQPQSGQPAHQPVEDFARLGLVPRVKPALLPAIHHIEALAQPLHEPRNLGGVVLQVGVERHQDRTLGGLKPRRQGGRLPKVAAERESSHPVVGLAQFANHPPAAIGRAVIDKDQLPAPLQPGAGCGDLPVQFPQAVTFVVDRNDQGEHAVERKEPVWEEPPPSVREAGKELRRRLDSTPSRASGERCRATILCRDHTWLCAAPTVQTSRGAGRRHFQFTPANRSFAGVPPGSGGLARSTPAPLPPPPPRRTGSGCTT